MILITAATHVAPDKRDQAIAAALEVQSATEQEPGCAEYRFWTAADDPNAVLLFERWNDHAALEAHLATQHVARFNETIAAVVDAAVVVSRYEVEGARPLR